MCSIDLLFNSYESLMDDYSGTQDLFRRLQKEDLAQGQRIKVINYIKNVVSLLHIATEE